MRKGILFLFLLFAPHLHAAKKTSRICLNMIVKNESEVIETCLASVKPFIDYWVIVDTGSTDGTQKIIKKTLKGIPGELHQRPWVNFAHNRNEALQLAKNKAQYLLLIDADEFLSCEAHFALPTLDQDMYYITVRQLGAVELMKPALLSTQLPWNWIGVIHEYIDSSIAKSKKQLIGIVNHYNTRLHSDRAKGTDKFLKSAAILEEALIKEPNNSRYVFYLAQSYCNAKNNALALQNYMKRAAMQSPDSEETFFAIYNCGKIQEAMGNIDGALQSYFKAHDFRPTRAEPLFRAAIVYRKQGNPFLGYLLTKHALTLPCPQENCVEYAAYDHDILIEFTDCAILTRRWEEVLDATAKLIANPKIPPETKSIISANRATIKKTLEQAVQPAQ